MWFFRGGIGEYIVVLLLGLVFRNIGTFIVLGLIGAGVSWYYIDQEAKDYQRTTERGELSAVQIRGFNATRLPNNVQEPAAWSISGVVRNEAERGIRALTFRVKVQDCAADIFTTDFSAKGSQSCETLGNTSMSTSLDVPPGEVRQFAGKVSFPNLPVLGRDPRIVYELSSVDVRK